MLYQCGFHLKGRDIDAADFEHVIAAPAVGVAAVGIAHVFVAALGPAALEGFAGLGAVGPVHHGGRRALDIQVTRFAVRHRCAIVAAQLHGVARNGPACGAVAHPVRLVGEEDVQHFGGAYAVHNVHTKVGLEALTQVGRQGLAGGGDQAQLHHAALWQIGVGQHAGKAGRGTVENGRLHATDLAQPALEGGVWRRTLAHQNRGGAYRHGEGQSIAQAIGKEQLGSRETDIVFLQIQDALGIQLASPIRVAVRMHAALGPASGARRIQPEARIIRAGGSGLLHGLVRLHKGLELHLGRMQGRRRMRHHHLGDFMVRLDHGGGERRQQSAGYQHRLGARMFQHIGIVVGGEQGVDCHRHQASVQGAQKAHRPVIAVVHQQQHALFAAQAQGPQAGGKAAYALFELAVAQGAVVVDESGLVSACCVFAQQVLGKVEHGWQCCQAFGASAARGCVWRIGSGLVGLVCGFVCGHGLSPRYRFYAAAAAGMASAPSRAASCASTAVLACRAERRW